MKKVFKFSFHRFCTIALGLYAIYLLIFKYYMVFGIERDTLFLVGMITLIVLRIESILDRWEQEESK